MNVMAAPSILSLTPRDGLFLKDGRGWFTNESGRAGCVEWPYAGTIRGALRTCLGRAHEQTIGRALGRDEWLSLHPSLRVDAVLPLCGKVGATSSATDRHWPAPRDAVIFAGDGSVQRLQPAASTTAGTIALDDSPETAALEGLLHPSPGEIVGKPASMPPWWCDEAFTSWLCGLPVMADAVSPMGRPVVRVQTHVAIDSTTGAATDGGLFSSSVIESLTYSADCGAPHQWSVAVIGSGFAPEELAGRRLRVGGDGRYAACSVLPPDTFLLPEPLRRTFAAKPRGLRLILVGHAGFSHGWLPAWLSAENGVLKGEMPGVGHVVLRSACVGRPVHVSGWDMAAQRPKPTRRLVPAGSVYFFEKADGGGFTAADAAALWLRPVGEATDPGEATGAAVPGVWQPD